MLIFSRNFLPLTYALVLETWLLCTEKTIIVHSSWYACIMSTAKVVTDIRYDWFEIPVSTFFFITFIDLYLMIHIVKQVIRKEHLFDDFNYKLMTKIKWKFPLITGMFNGFKYKSQSSDQKELLSQLWHF